MNLNLLPLNYSISASRASFAFATLRRLFGNCEKDTRTHFTFSAWSLCSVYLPLSVSRFCYNFVIVLAWLTTEAVPNCLHMCEKHFGQHNLWSWGGGWESNLRKLIQLECGKYVELFAATLLLSSTCCCCFSSSSSSLLQLCILANNSSLFFVTKISCWVAHFCN